MRIKKPYGSKERLYELFDRVAGYKLSEDKEDVLDFMRVVKKDYPDDKEIVTKFLNLAKRKGVDIAKREYDTKYSPETKKTDREKNREILNKRNLESKKNDLYNKYKGVILLIQNLIKQNGLYEQITSIFSKYFDKKLSGMVMNRRYSNLFNNEIKDIISFNKKYLTGTKNLIPLEFIELNENKPTNIDDSGISLSIWSYVSSTIFINNKIDNDDFLFYQIELNPDIDERKNDDEIGVKSKKMKRLADKYNRLAMSRDDLDKFLTEFIDIFTTPEKFYNDRIFSTMNENLGNDKENIINSFINYVGNELNILDRLPEITISNNSEDAIEMKSFGKYTPEDNTLMVVIANRNLADFLRTLCHELVHHKQYLDGEITFDSSNTGSDIENEANAKAGIFLRNFGKENPSIFEN